MNLFKKIRYEKINDRCSNCKKKNKKLYIYTKQVDYILFYNIKIKCLCFKCLVNEVIIIEEQVIDTDKL